MGRKLFSPRLGHMLVVALVAFAFSVNAARVSMEMPTSDATEASLFRRRLTQASPKPPSPKPPSPRPPSPRPPSPSPPSPKPPSPPPPSPKPPSPSPPSPKPPSPKPPSPKPPSPIRRVRPAKPPSPPPSPPSPPGATPCKKKKGCSPPPAGGVAPCTKRKCRPPPPGQISDVRSSPDASPSPSPSPSPTAPTAALSFTRGGFRYDIYADRSATFLSAEAACAAAAGGPGHLVSLLTAEESAALESLLRSAGAAASVGNGSSVSLWIGLHMRLADGKFWTDDNQLEYLPVADAGNVVDGACYSLVCRAASGTCNWTPALTSSPATGCLSSTQDGYVCKSMSA